MKNKFESYPSQDYTEVNLRENLVLFGTTINYFHGGQGHGVFYGSTYCRDTGEGEGFGYDNSDIKAYPVQLIQYWK